MLKAAFELKGFVSWGSACYMLVLGGLWPRNAG